MSVSVGIACPVLDNSNPAWVEDWGKWSPAYRRQVLEAMAGRGIVGAAEADADSFYPPDLSYPIGHPCNRRSDGGEPEGQAPAPPQPKPFATRQGWLPLPGLGILGAAPDWLKWLAIAAVALGVVLVVRRRNR